MPDHDKNEHMGTERSTYSFPVCLICECEIDESNEHKHQGPLHDVQTVQLAPLHSIRGRLLSKEACEAAAKWDFEDFERKWGGRTTWEAADDKERSDYRESARSLLAAALAAQFPESPPDRPEGGD